MSNIICLVKKSRRAKVKNFGIKRTTDAFIVLLFPGGADTIPESARAVGIFTSATAASQYAIAKMVDNAQANFLAFSVPLRCPPADFSGADSSGKYVVLVYSLVLNDPPKCFTSYGMFTDHEAADDFAEYKATINEAKAEASTVAELNSPADAGHIAFTTVLHPV